MNKLVKQWHDYAASRDYEKLDQLLDDDVVFHSPVVHSPQQGKIITTQYLRAADQVLNNGHFRYVREAVGKNSAVLEFETELQGIYLNGVDMIKWNDAGKIIEFKVMVRPLKAINMVHQLMGAELQKNG